MKLVEVVILLGSQCVSPMQHGANVTDVGKVPCAVLIHRDEQSGEFAVSPPDSVRKPEVLVALGRTAASANPIIPPSPQAAMTVPDPKDRSVQFTPVDPDSQAEANTSSPPYSSELGVADVVQDEPSIEPAGAKPRLAKITTRYADVASEQAQSLQVPAEPDIDAAAELAVTDDEVTVESAAKPVQSQNPAKSKATRKPPSTRKKAPTQTATASRTASSRTSKNPPDKCGKTRVAKWYTKKDGHRKYRCVLRSSADVY